ncbi:MAG: hypothetical protein JJT93_11865, partial [Gammaproteobacteria bacterium]|nr:hypothetical protein [Gammaproteobacteria bacterium]
MIRYITDVPGRTDFIVDEDGPKFPTTGTEKALDASAIAAGFTPVVGGAISAVLSGMSQARKLNRVAGMLNELADDLAGFHSEVSDEYVKTEDFEDLLEHTLRRAAEERSDEVRALYRKFLHRAITAPGDDYDEQIAVLKALERVRVPHVAVLGALLRPPSPEAHKKLMGSPIQTLRERTGLTDNEIKAAVATLNEIKATNMSTLSVMMTGHGSEGLQGSVTSLGEK